MVLVARGEGSGALAGPTLSAQYNYDTIFSTNLNLNLSLN